MSNSSPKFSSIKRLHCIPVQSVIAIIPTIIVDHYHKSLLSSVTVSADFHILFFNQRSVLVVVSYISHSPACRTMLVFQLGYPIIKISLLAHDGCGNHNIVSADCDMGCPLFNHMVSLIKQSSRVNISDNARALTNLRLSCKKTNDYLCSGSTDAMVRSRHQGRELGLQINRQSLELNMKHISKEIMRCLMEVGIEQDALDEIVLARVSTNLSGGERTS